MELKTLKSEYLNKKIDKRTYATELYKKIFNLQQYQCFLQNSCAKEIIIGGNYIRLKIQELFFDVPYSFEMEFPLDDYGSIAMTVLGVGSYETSELLMVQKLMTLAGCESFVDIGANQGWYSLNIAKCFSNVHVYSFEPIPNTFDCLKTNIHINGLDNRIVAVNMGLSNLNGNSVFYFDETESGAASLRDLRERDTVKEVQCRNERLDEVKELKNICIDFIKCDVEGAELLVFQGGIESIKKSKPIVFSEMLRKWSAKFGYHPNEIIRLFSDMNYRCFVIRGDGLQEFFEVNEETVETNYFFLHAEKHKDIINKLTL